MNELQVFLGFTNFYRRFIEGYSRVTRPLTDLLKKEAMRTPFQMNDESLQAFGELKERFTRTPMLRHFDPMLRIQVETDASGFAAAGVLSQLFGTDSESKCVTV